MSVLFAYKYIIPEVIIFNRQNMLVLLRYLFFILTFFIYTEWKAIIITFNIFGI